MTSEREQVWGKKEIKREKIRTKKMKEGRIIVGRNVRIFKKRTNLAIDRNAAH